jgi:hypothetical protein
MPAIAMMALTMLVLAGSEGNPGHGKGTIRYESKGGPVVVTIMYAYLVTGPSSVDGTPVRRLVFSADDLGTSLRACDSMLCAGPGLTDGLTVDLDAAPRLEYWLVAGDQRVQYSGTAALATMTLTADTPTRLAGRWRLDASAAGGPRLDIEFDAGLFREFSTAR